MPIVHRLGAKVPWGAGTGTAEEPQKDIAPRRQVPYRCERGCEFTLTLAARAEVPDVWDCHCGRPARREGAPDDAQRRPAYATPGTGKYERAGSDVTPMGQLRKRRKDAELEAQLAERMAQVRAGGWSR